MAASFALSPSLIGPNEGPQFGELSNVLDRHSGILGYISKFWRGFFPLLITLAADLISQVASMSPYYGLGCYDVCPKLMFVHGGMDDDAERVAC